LIIKSTENFGNETVGTIICTPYRSVLMLSVLGTTVTLTNCWDMILMKSKHYSLVSFVTKRSWILEHPHRKIPLYSISKYKHSCRCQRRFHSFAPRL